jgi:hypothetical protein
MDFSDFMYHYELSRTILQVKGEKMEHKVLYGSRPSWRSKLKGAAVAAAIFGGAVGGVATVGAEAAGASAYSCTGYGYGFSWGYPSQFCANTVGSSTYVDTVGAGYSAPIAWAGWLTNTRIEVQFFNYYGQNYWTAYSSVQWGGSSVGAWKFALYRWMQPGYVKYTLLSNGAYIASVEQQIKP